MLAITRFELMYYIKSKKEVTVIIVLYAFYFLLIPFAMKDDLQQLPHLFSGLLWLASITVLTLASSEIYERDQRSGRLDYYRLLPSRLEWAVLAKWLACYLCLGLPMVAMLPVAQLLMGVAPSLHQVATVLVGLAAITAITNLASALMVGLQQRGGALLGLLVLPLMIPVMIFGSNDTGASGIAFLGGMALFMLPLLCLAGASSIRAGS